MAEPSAPSPIDPAFAARVERLHASLDALDHYALLGVAPSASAKEIKRAYFARAPELHPDRYFGKALGGLGAKMSAIFARMTVAYETLASGESRAAYDASLGAAAKTAPKRPSAAPRRASVRPAPAAAQRAATPEDERLRKLALARRLASAVRPLGPTPAATPREPAAPPPPPSPRPPMVVASVAQRVMLADAAAREGHWEAASKHYQAAALAKTDDPILLEKAATALVRAGGDARTAIDLARRAVGLTPERLEVRLVLAEAYLVAGNPAAAARELAVAKKLSPGDRRVALLAARIR